MRRVALPAALCAVCLVGAGLAGKGVWIFAKAQTAQYLIARAWNRNALADSAIAPWPWADTQVLARLRVPALGVERYVLAGAHGQALAFGPGHLSGTPMPGDPGNSVIAGHRDTHFEFLQHLDSGDEIFLDMPRGRTVRYRVSNVWVTEETDMRPLADRSAVHLTLITCFPFDALRAGGPLRFIVEAQA